MTRERIKSVLLLITIAILLVTRFLEHKNISIAIPVTLITDVAMIILIVLALLKNNGNAKATLFIYFLNPSLHPKFPLYDITHKNGLWDQPLSQSPNYGQLPQ